jgi:ankyrin repeat protein
MSHVDRTRVASQQVAHRTALYKAFHVNSYNLMVYLIEECDASINQYVVPTKMTEKSTVLAQAVCRNKLEIVKLLVKHGANINQADEEGMLRLPVILPDGDTIGMTPILQACRLGHLDMVRYLVHVGADVNLVTKAGKSCLMAGIESTDVTDYLLSLGGEVNIPDVNGDTALHWAVHHASRRSVESLVKNRAEVNTKNLEGNTALHVAILRNTVDMVRLLLESGADPYIRNKKKEDALMLAVLAGNTMIIDIIVHYHKTP